MSTFFVLGKIRSYDNHLEWEMQGLFSSRDKALSAYSTYKDKPLIFIAPVELDCAASEVSSEWPSAYYPWYEEDVI